MSYMLKVIGKLPKLLQVFLLSLCQRKGNLSVDVFKTTGDCFSILFATADCAFPTVFEMYQVMEFACRGVCSTVRGLCCRGE